MCAWASGGGRAIICFKLLAGRGKVGETAILKESKGRRGGEGSEEKKKCQRKNGGREREQNER